MIRAKIQIPAGSEALALGLLVAALMALSLMLDAKPAHADTFTVTNTNDSGNGSLRKAIEDTNATSVADTIRFNIPGTGVKTILLRSELPEITRPLTIDGYTQPGSKKNTQKVGSTNAVLLVELNGANAGPANGLEIAAPNVVVRGLAINLFDNGIVTKLGATGARIEGNFIGTDATGAFDQGNSFTGVFTDGGKHIVGGTTPDKRNIISGNNDDGIILGGEGGNKVQGNLIGTKKDGTSPRENSGEGVRVDSSNNTVGGANPGEANTIAFNSDEGVVVNGAGNTGNRILGNSIFANEGPGIDLGNDGRTLNDPKDPDTGPNNLQNFPVLTSATTVGGETTIKGTLDSTPGKTFTLRFFANPSGEDEGKTFLGTKSVKTGSGGKVSFTFKPSQAVVGQNVTATATNGGGNTSEFSDPVGRATV